MKSLCITGLVQEDLDFVSQVLAQAGMQPALPASRDTKTTIAYWHDQVLKLPLVRYTEMSSDESVADSGSSRSDIGRLWEQIASDIFISNLEADTWGWADTRSAEVLPFWKGFDPQTRFVLVAVRPERFIAHHIEASDQGLDHQALLVRWVQFHRAMLRFHRENPKISVLVDFDNCLAQIGAFIKVCNTQFGLDLKTLHFPNVVREPISDIARLLAAEICATHEDHHGFALDLEASLTPVGYHHGAFRVPTPAESISSYREMKLAHVGRLAEINAFKADLSKLNQHLLSEAETTKLSIAGLSQAHESNLLKCQEATAELDRIKLLPPVTAYPQEAETIKKLQVELEQLKKLNAEGLKALETAKTAYQQILEKEKDTQEENDLLLAQLHQVQEELENYFLKYQEADQKLQALEVRWHRMLAKYPDDSQVDSVALVSTQAGEAGLTQWRVRGLELGSRVYEDVVFESFIEAGVACLMFAKGSGSGTANNTAQSKAQKKAKNTALSSDAEGSLFLRWPGLADDATVVIATVGDESTGPMRARALQALSATDWQLVRALVALLAKELKAPNLLKLPKGFDGQVQSQAFAELLQALEQLPPMLHFDGLRLGLSQEEPEYEFLTFTFDQCAMGQRFVPEFEFRFASVNIPSGSFGSNPRLEFHEGRSKAGFEGWFEESSDDYGPKLELRFARPNAMDLEVWKRLTTKDQGLIAALIAQLPVFISHLKGSTRSVYRSWDEWLSLADEVHQTFLSCTGLLETPGPESRAESLDRSSLVIEDFDFVEVSAKLKKNKTPTKSAAKVATKTTTKPTTKPTTKTTVKNTTKPALAKKRVTKSASTAARRG